MTTLALFGWTPEEQLVVAVLAILCWAVMALYMIDIRLWCRRKMQDRRARRKPS